MSRSSGKRRGRPGGEISLVTVVVVTQVVIALLTATAVYAAWLHLDGNIKAGNSIQHQHGKRIPKQDQGESTEPLNILVLGTDSRSGAGDSIDGEAGCDCSDTTILVHVSADRSSAYAVSIPRDSLVKPVACTRDHEYLDTGLVEWNQAYAAGGAACTAQEVQQDLHVYVDDYVVVDFAGFKNMVNAIGGVNVCIPFELSDPSVAHVTFEPGKSVHLDGDRALSYVRLRYVLSGSDLGRIKRQQVFVSAMTDKLLSAGTLTRPDRLYSFANALTSSITTNPEIAHVKDLVDLARQFRNIDLRHIRFVTLPNQAYDVPQSDPRWGRVQVLPGAYRLMRIVNRDQPLGVFTHGSLRAGHRPRHPSAEAKAQAAAAGVCA
ncbi:MAG TPA: LCP family protein [Nocardioides sp.]|jgi:LCP family protein required for cell wall assembly|uniref:LCP family protein n=1 Tax=Nocardioides sp. TaxID=35761 RepID=UPI002E2EA9E8|nr:LCP family protein [Nocardioides sp.]HEX3932438.1 LCP family protein [Nocardioides sp.]